jgi:hypothetical protein
VTEEKSGFVSAALLRQFFHLVHRRCPRCDSLGLESDYNEPVISVVGSVLKVKLYCTNAHETTWCSSACAGEKKVFIVNSVIPVAAVFWN